MDAAYLNRRNIRRLVADIVPTYHPADEKSTVPEFATEAP